MKSKIANIAYFLPERVLTNENLNNEFPEWSAEKISEKTGIYERHIAENNICSSDLAFESCKKLFDDNLIEPNIIDFILLCTQSPDYFLPTTACLLQERLGIPKSAGALDFNLGCSGFIYGLGIAKGLIETSQAKNVLLITAETYSKFIHHKDKSVRTIFGDASASILISASETGNIGPFVYGTDGKGAKNLIVKTGGMRHKRTDESSLDFTDENGNTRNEDSLYMNGGDIFAFTLREIPPVVNKLYELSGLKEEDISLFIFHQANKFMLDAVRKKLKVPEEKFYICMEHFGNTVSAMQLMIRK